MARDGLFISIARALIARHFRAGGEIDAEFLASTWQVIVGDELATYTVPFRIEEQELVVAVSSEPWLNEMSYRDEWLLARLNDLLPEPLEDVRFFVGSAGMFPDRPDKNEPSPAPEGELTESDREILDDVEDEELRDLMAHVRRLARGRDEDA